MKKNIFYFLLTIIIVANIVHAQNSIVTIEVLPYKVALNTGETYRFIARAYNQYNEEVRFKTEWTATGGTVDSQGLFRAGNRAGVYSVMATYRRTGVRGSATVFINSNNNISQGSSDREIVRLEIDPGKIALKPREKVRFNIKAYNKNDQSLDVLSLSWKFTGGSMTPDGIYKAGGSPGKYWVEAMAANGVKARAIIQIEGVSKGITYLKIWPKRVRLKPYEQKRFFVTAYNSSGNSMNVTPIWQATGGTIDKEGIYTAGSEPGMYMVQAMLNNINAISKITIKQYAIDRIDVTPNNVVLEPNQTIKFRATAFDKRGRKVNASSLWNASGGVITNAGVYQAGPVPGKYELNITMGNITKTISIMIKPDRNKAVSLEIIPRNVTISPYKKIKFQAKVYNKIGQKVFEGITWYTYGGGTIDKNGVYTAGATGGKYLLKAATDSGLTDRVWITVVEKKKVYIHKKHDPNLVYITRWKTGHGNNTYGQILIKGRVFEGKGHTLKLMLESITGQEEVLAEVGINRYGTRFTFTGDYVRSTTKVIKIVLFDPNNHIVYEFKRDA